MSKTAKFLGLGVLIAMVIAIAIGGYFFPQVHQAFGAVSTSCSGFTSCYNDLYLTTTFGGTGSLQTDGTVKVSSTGTSINRVNTGTCFIQSYANTIAASSTATVECQGTAQLGGTPLTTASDTPLTGVTFGDNVTVTLASTTATTTFEGLNLIGAYASSTAGYLELILSNLTGTTFDWRINTKGLNNATGTASFLVTH